MLPTHCGVRENPVSETPNPCSSRSVMSRTLAPSCSMLVTGPAAAMLASSCEKGRVREGG